MKKIFTEGLENKLIKYSLAAGAILAGQNSANASVDVTSSGHGLPATVNSGSPSYSINFDNNSAAEIKIIYGYYAGGASGNKGPYLSVRRDGATVNVSFLAKTIGGYVYPYALSQNYGIPSTPANKWAHGSTLAHPNNTATLAFIPKSYLPHGYWRNQTTAKYLGVKFHLSDGIHYGWVKMTTSGASSATIIAYAYETSVNTPIPAPLPVELTSFTALAAGSLVELRWNTATEINNYGFEIQRTLFNPSFGKGGAEAGWEKIGFVQGAGNSNSPKDYSFVDKNPLSAEVQYRLKQIDNDGAFKYSSVVTVNSLLSKFELFQNYPNPFNPNTTIKYSIPKAEHVMLKVYDELGKEVSTLVDEDKEAGYYNLTFDGSGLTSGIYYYRITAGEFNEVKKLMLLK
jgi:Secretion system C-terminal sorting domain